MIQLSKQCKKYMATELSHKFRSYSGFFVTDAAGLPNKEMEELRRKFKAIRSDYMVVKNTICRLVFKELKIDQLNSFINGTIGIGLAQGDSSILSSKILVDFSNKHKSLKIKGGILDGVLITTEKINELAALPPREVLLARIAGGMKAPISNLVNLLQANIRNLVNVLNSISKKK